MREKIKIVEVGPRDGLQNESRQWSVSDRVTLIQKLGAAGLRFIEGGSFVSPKAIPQMTNSDEVWQALKKDSSLELSFLVANQKGLDTAIDNQVTQIAVFSATSDTFTQKNIRQTVDESLNNFHSLTQQALERGLRVRGYVSTAFGCPYEGHQDVKRIIAVIRRLFEMGCYEVSIGDTIGVAHPKQVKEVFSTIANEFEISQIAAHLHDTRGMAIVNLSEAIDQGVRIVDSSIGGLGGCPYAQGSSGNVATEGVVYFLEGLGFDTGVELTSLLKICEWIEEIAERKLTSPLYLSKPQKIFYF